MQITIFLGFIISCALLYMHYSDKVPWGGDVPLFSIFLCLVSVPSMTLDSWCVWDWSPQYTFMSSFVHLDHGSLTFSSFWPILSATYHLTLSALGEILLLILMLPCFDWPALQDLVFRAICIFKFSCLPLCASWFNVDYSLLYLVKFYFSGGSIDQ